MKQCNTSNSSSCICISLTWLLTMEVIPFLIIVDKTAYFVLTLCLPDLFPEASDASTATSPGHLPDGGPSVFGMYSERLECRRAVLSLPKPSQVQFDQGALVVYSARSLRIEKGYRLCSQPHANLSSCDEWCTALSVRVVLARYDSFALLLHSMLAFFRRLATIHKATVRFVSWFFAPIRFYITIVFAHK